MRPLTQSCWKLAAAVSLLLAGQSALAATVIPLPEAAADYALRLDMIARAQERISLSIFHFDADPEAGRAVLHALREAARRGVKVRFISAELAAENSKAQKIIPALLNDDALPTRPEAILFGEMFRTRLNHPNAKVWTTFDEKYMVVDGREAVVGGRGVGADYFSWEDYAYYVDSPATAQALEANFNHLFSEARAIYPERLKDPKSRFAYRERAASAPSPRLESLRGVIEKLGMRFETPDPVVLHHDVIGAMMAGRTVKNDPILLRGLELSKTSSRVLVYVEHAILDPRMRDALIAAAARGARVELMTNSREAEKGLSPVVAGYDSSIKTLIQLQRGGVKIREWLPKPGASTFLHQKGAVFDSVMLVGSHNFAASSTDCYDQVDLEIRSQALTDHMAGVFEAQAREHTFEPTEAFLRHEAAMHPFSRMLGRFLEGLF